MQAKTIVKTFKSYPNMPEKLQLRLLKHIENKSMTTPEQIEAKLLRAQMLKKQKDDEKVIKNQKHLQNVSESYLKAIDMKTTRTHLRNEILVTKMKLAEENAAKNLNEKVSTAQKLGSERVEKVKTNFVYDDNDIQKAIELSLQSMKQERAKQVRDEIQKEKVSKAKCSYNHAALNLMIDQDLTDLSYSDRVRQQVVLKKIGTMADKLKEKQMKAEERRQMLIDDKIQKAKDAQIKFFSGKQKLNNDDVIIIPSQTPEVAKSQKVIAEEIRDQVLLKKIDTVAEKLKVKQAKAEARRQQLTEDKIQKAKDAHSKRFSAQNKAIADEPVMVEKLSSEEFAQSQLEASNMSFKMKQDLLEQQQQILEAQLENVKQQMNLNLAQKFKATSWTVCNKTFKRIQGSESDKQI